MIGTSISHYQITAKLGAGGMGEVYRARDHTLGRDVAIKVLPALVEEDERRVARFQREARLLAALSHPHIGTVFGFERHEGKHFLVLELIEGETLAERLQRGPLPILEALEICRQIAEALEAAHEKRIIHRDLKPANIKLTPHDKVKVLDFGLAKAMEPLARDAETVKITTVEGGIMGTPGYMSPEQASGKEVDAQSDIWAFGCILFECLTGKRLFNGNTITEAIGAVMHKEPDWSELPSQTPPSVESLLRKCLERNPNRRLRDMRDTVAALENGYAELRNPRRKRIAMFPIVAGAGVILALLAVLIWATLHRSAAPSKSVASVRTNTVPAQPIQKSVAVLPFVNLSPDKADEYLSDGITEELINSLTKIRSLQVPGRSSCFAFKGKTEEGILRKVGEQLRVETVLEGSVRKAGDTLRVTAQLINVRDGFNLWSETYDRQMTNILAVQSDIAARVAEALALQLGVEESQAFTKARTNNPEAHRLYLLGRYHFAKGNTESIRTAMEHFREAAKIDPNYALAYCGIADAWGWLGGLDTVSREAWAQERQMAEKALAIDPNLAEAHLSLGIALAGAFDWEGAERSLLRAIKLNPRNAFAYDQYGFVLSCQGRLAEGLSFHEKAIEIDPLSVSYLIDKSFALYHMRRYDDSIREGKKALQMDSNFSIAHKLLGENYFWKREIKMSLSHFEEAYRLDPTPYNASYLVHVWAASGNRTKAEALLAELAAQRKDRYVSPSVELMLHLGVGETQEALTALERCYKDQDAPCWFLKVAPIYDSLRAEPRFQALLKKVGLDK